MAATSKPKQTDPVFTMISSRFDALKHMVIPLKEKEVKISISKTNPGCFELNINGEVQGTQIGPGFDLLITQSTIEFRPQEIKIDNTSVTRVPLQSETSQEKPTQQKTLDNPPEQPREIRPPRKVLLQNRPTAIQTTSENNRTVKKATTENFSKQWALQIHVSDNTSYPLKYFLAAFGDSEKKLGLDTTGVMTIPSHSENDFTRQYILPFTSAENLEKAMKAGQLLRDGDQNITIQIWNPQGATQPVQHVPNSSGAKTTVVHRDGATTIFVKNISNKDQMDRLQQIFSSLGPVSHVTTTSYRTAIVEFENTDAAKKALQEHLPSPNQNLQCSKYIAIAKQRKQHPPTLDASHRAAAMPAQDTLDAAIGNTHERAQFSAEDNEQRPGGGGMDAVLPSEQSLTTTQLFIQSHWNKNADNNWTHDTKQLDEQLKTAGLVCAQVNSRGDCGYEAIIKAGVLTGNFRALKDKTLQFVRTNERSIRIQLVPFQRSGEIAENMDVFMQRIQHDLTTDGKYADNYTLQLVAWTLQRTIVIYDTFDFHQIELRGQHPWSTDNPASIAQPIYIAYRQHRMFSLYDAEYNPLGKLEGHYWAIVSLQQQPAIAVPTRNYFQPLDSPANHPTLGNGRRSAPPRQ